jgi:hypothetical protein
VTGEKRTLDLERLSPEDKDRLILGLWADLRDERAKAQALAERLAEIAGTPPGTSGEQNSLLEELRRCGTRKDQIRPRTDAAKVRLGRGLGLLKSRAVIGFILLLALAFLLDFGIGWYQQRQLEQARLAALRLQTAAFSDLLVELKSVAYEPDGKSYRLTLSLRNLDPEQPIYVMLSPIRVFEQSGFTWHEVPARASTGQATTVVKLGESRFQTIFEPNLKDWTSVMPGYMHIRFDNNMLISQRSDPEEDIVERDDPNYVYLKPYGADDEAIRRQLRFTGTPPVYIPMPPH